MRSFESTNSSLPGLAKREVLMFVSAAVVLRLVADEDCADIVILHAEFL
jgi:hypothetical protein